MMRYTRENHFVTVVLLLAFQVSLCSGIATAGWFGCGLEPLDLRCEYRENPLGIDVEKPRLSWKIQAGNERGLKQTAYRILVASSEKLLREGKADLWDSGKVASDRSIQVEYAGKPLESRMQCFWRVKAWTTAGDAWSKPAFWTMGLLKPEDWQAKWIAMKSTGTLVHPWLRRNFVVASAVRSAKVLVNTPGQYELYVNGRRVGEDVLAPPYSVFRKRIFCNEHDVSGLLRTGTNCIALWLGPGWYQPRYGNPYNSPIVRAQLEIEAENGRAIIGTDAAWRASDSCISQIGSWGWNDMGGERWDSRRFVKDWNQVGFDDSAWAPALQVPAPNGQCSWQGVLGSRLRQPVAPKKIYAHNNKWVVDFGTTLTGWMRLRMSGLKPGKKIVIDYADLNDRSLAFQPNADGFQTDNQRDIFVAGSSEQDEFCCKFNQHAFRYAVIEGLSQAPAATDVEAMTVETDLEKAGDFECSNDLFNRIHQITVHTYHTQIPCGVLGGGEPREKLGYGDGGTFLTGMLYNLRSDAFFQKWLGDWCDNQRADGFLGHTAPDYYKAGGGPSWGAEASELVRRLYLYYGDYRAVAERYATLRKYVDHLENHTEQDILRLFNPYRPGAKEVWQFLGDWVAPGSSPDNHEFVFETTEQREFFNNCWRVLLWDQLAGYAELLGDKAETERCRQRLEVLRPLIHKTYYDHEKKTYRVNRQGYLVIALYSKIVPPELRASIFKQLQEDIVVAHKGHLDTGMQTTFLLLDLLTKEGRNDLVDLIMNQTTFPSWGFLVKERKVTSWPETWAGWGSQAILVTASPGAWFYEGLAGITPDFKNPGFKHFQIRPAMVNSVTWVKCHYESIYGRIESNWKREGDRLTMDVTIPPNTTVTVYVPAKNPDGVTTAAVAKFRRMENGAAVFEVGSGRYKFRSNLEK